MTRDEIIRMAEDCGISHHYYEIPLSKKGVVSVESCTDRLCQFAKLIAQQEREMCATICEEMGIEGYGTIAIGMTIRARGEA